MTAVTWAWMDVVNGPENVWNVPANWSTGALPGPGDDVVIPAGSEPCSVVTGAAINIQSLDVGGALGIFDGQFSVSGGVTIENGGGLGIDDSSTINNVPVTFSVGGTLTNNGLIGFASIATVSIATFDDAVTGYGDMRGQVTIGNATIAYNGGADFSMGAGCNGGDHGGNLKVTGTLDLTGRFVVGNPTPNSGTSSETMSADDLVVAATGRFVAVDSSVTLGDVSNSGANADSGLAGFYVDPDNPATGSIVHITGTFDNIGQAAVGGASGAASTMTIGTLKNEFKRRAEHPHRIRDSWKRR